MKKRWIGCPVEEAYFGEERKKGKKERKIASKTDRSKYKKTDLDKLEKVKRPTPSFENSALGKVLAITSRGIECVSDQKIYYCTLKGALKKEMSREKNLVTVGDNVYFFPQDNGEGTIAHVLPRKTFLSRADNLSRRKQQLIAANIDLVIITCSLISPPLKPTLIDRYLIAAKVGNLEPLIVVNKIDLLETAKDEEVELFNDFMEAYPDAISISVKTGEGLETLKEKMKDKSSVFSGQSGVGKSSLINAMTGLQLKTQSTVHKTNKGAHTTTSAKLIPLPFGGFCIDTPGIKSFGVFSLKENEIEPYFTEIHKVGRQCKFPNCRHEEEEDCAVKAAVEKGKISPLRFFSYLSLLKSVREEHLRR